MAKDEESQVEEGKEGKKKKSPIKIIILAVLFLSLIGGGLFVWKMGILEKFSGGDGKEAAAKETEKELQAGIGPIYPLETFIVNLVDPRGKRYLKAKLELELDSEKVIPEIDKRLPQFRDTILTILSSKAFEDITQLEGKFQLRVEIVSMLNQYLKTGKIKKIYFTEFIVQ